MEQERRGLALTLAIGLHLAIVVGLWWSAHWVRQPESAVEVELWAGALEASPSRPPVDPSPPRPLPVPPPLETPPVRAPDIVAEPPAPKPKAPQAAKPKPAMPPPQPSKPIEPKQPTDTKPNPAKPNEVSGKLKVPPLDTAAPRLDALAARAQAAEAAGRAREFDAYLAQVRNAIRRNMNYADEGGPNLEVEVEIRLLPDMTVMDARITRTSGTPTFDDAVRRAVKLTGRYPPLPASIEFGVLRHHLLRYRLHE